MLPKRERGNLYRTIYLLIFLVGLVAFLVSGLLPDGRRGIFLSDGEAQFYPFVCALKRMFYEGSQFQYSWELGLGMGTSGWLAYYLMSPFNIILLLCPDELMQYGYVLIILLKLATAGTVFAWFLKKMLHAKADVMIYCSLCYAFCGFATTYYFVIMWLDGMIFLPVVLYHLRKMVLQEKMVSFTVVLSILFVVNYYIAYIIGMFTFFVFVGMLFYYRPQKIGMVVIRFFLSVLLAFGISAFFIFPVVLQMLFRVSKITGTAEGLLIPQFYLSDFISALFMDSYTFFLGNHPVPFVYSGLMVIVLLPLYFCNPDIEKREKKYAAITIAGILLVMVIPVLDRVMHVGKIPSGFYYRDVFLFSFVVLVLLCRQLPYMFRDLKERRIKKSYGIVIYLCVLFLMISLIVVSLIQRNEVDDAVMFDMNALKCIINVLFLVLIYTGIIFSKKRVLYVLLILEVICNTLFTSANLASGILYVDPEVRNMEDVVGEQQLEELERRDSDDFYRIVRNISRMNASLQLGYRGIDFFSSAYNQSTVDLTKALGITTRFWAYCAQGENEIADMLFNVKYRMHDIIRKSKYIQDFWNSLNDWESYPGENSYIEAIRFYLPIGFCTADTIRDCSLSMESVNEDFDIVGNFKKILYAMTGDSDVAECIYEIPVEECRLIKNNAEFKMTDNGHIAVTRSGKDETDGWTYEVEVPENTSLYCSYEFSDRKNTVGTSTSDETSGVGRRGISDKCSCLVQASDRQQTGTITFYFNETEQCEFKHLQFYAVDISRLEKVYQKLSKNVMTDIRWNRDGELWGSINVDQDQMLYTSIPYEDGWELWVDGKKSEITPLLNDSLIGARLPVGEHRIHLKYTTPGRNLGAAITMVSVLLLVVIEVKERTKKKAF